MGKILVAGSINMDVVTRTKHHPKAGETIFGHSLHYIAGGKGSNQAVAAARLSDHVYLIGKLGRDPFGDALTDFLKGEKLNLSYLGYSNEQPSGIALITVNDESENTIVVVSGSNFHLTESDIQEVAIQADDIIVSVFEIPQQTIKVLFERAKQIGAKTVLNPAPATPFIDGLLPLVDYLVLNETELAFFAGVDRMSDDPNQIESYVSNLRTSSNQTFIVTLGKKGVVCISGNEIIHRRGVEVDAIDTTGAGDCFTGALSVALFENMSLADSLKFANIAASLSVQKLGASASMPYRSDVDAALRK